MAEPLFYDAAVPPRVDPPPARPIERAGVVYRATRWTPETLATLADHLADAGRRALSGIETGELIDAWGDVAAEFRDPASAVRRRLDPPLARLSGLSPAGLAAGLEAVLGGVRRETAAAFAREARRARDPRPAWVVLASNVPALAVQPLLPALLVRRPVLIESSSAEPLFAPAFVTALSKRLPALREAVAAITWPGGARDLEAAVLERVGPVLAYGGAETIADLERRAGERLIAYGPKLSLAVVGAEVDPAAIADGLARDVALFDQRGCLSIQAVYVASDAAALAEALARALARYAERWPPGPAVPELLSEVQQLRAETTMRGLRMLPASAAHVAAGTVIVEGGPSLRPSPGLRTVYVYPLPDLGGLPALLAPWRGRLQGAALAGDAARRLAPALEELGVSRVTPPGELQTPDASWHNGGVSPLAALGG